MLRHIIATIRICGLEHDADKSTWTCREMHECVSCNLCCACRVVILPGICIPLKTFFAIGDRAGFAGELHDDPGQQIPTGEGFGGDGRLSRGARRHGGAAGRPARRSQGLVGRGRRCMKIVRGNPRIESTHTTRKNTRTTEMKKNRVLLCAVFFFVLLAAAGSKRR